MRDTFTVLVEEMVVLPNRGQWFKKIYQMTNSSAAILHQVSSPEDASIIKQVKLASQAVN